MHACLKKNRNRQRAFPQEPNTDNVLVDPAAEEGFGERLASRENTLMAPRNPASSREPTALLS